MMIDRLYQQAGGDLTPEQHILLAVIDQALYDALVNSATGSWGRILKADAEAFLRSDYCGWILEQLLINRDWFNREITKLRAAAKILAARDVAREEQRAVERGSLL